MLDFKCWTNFKIFATFCYHPRSLTFMIWGIFKKKLDEHYKKIKSVGGHFWLWIIKLYTKSWKIYPWNQVWRVMRSVFKLLFVRWVFGLTSSQVEARHRLAWRGSDCNLEVQDTPVYLDFTRSPIQTSFVSSST